jgi:fatty acid desaturase
MVEKTKWYEYSPGVTSALRVGFMMGMVTGTLGLFVAFVLAILIFITQRWEGIPLVGAIVTACGGIMAISDIAKGIQAHAEEKHPQGELNE